MIKRISIGQTPIIRMRITDSLVKRNINKDDITSIYYTLYSLEDDERVPVAGHTNIEISLDSIKSEIKKDDPDWTIDKIGYNILIYPDTTEYPFFADTGLYRLSITFNIKDRNSHTEHILFNVI